MVPLQPKPTRGLSRKEKDEEATGELDGQTEKHPREISTTGRRGL